MLDIQVICSFCFSEQFIMETVHLLNYFLTWLKVILTFCFYIVKLTIRKITPPIFPPVGKEYAALSTPSSILSWFFFPMFFQFHKGQIVLHFNLFIFDSSDVKYHFQHQHIYWSFLFLLWVFRLANPFRYLKLKQNWLIPG